MTRQSYEAGDNVITMMMMIEWIDNEQEKTVGEHRISLPNVVSGALVLGVTCSRTVGRTGQK